MNIEYKTTRYLVAGNTEPNLEKIGEMITDGNVEKIEWIMDWLQNGTEPVIVLTEKDTKKPTSQKMGLKSGKPRMEPEPWNCLRLYS
jgi:hypothetical protein